MRLNYKNFKKSLIFFAGFRMTFLLLLTSFNSFAETTIEPKIIEYFLTEIEELKNQITNFEKETKKSFFMLNLFQFITFGIFVVFMTLLYIIRKIPVEK